MKYSTVIEDIYNPILNSLTQNPQYQSQFVTPAKEKSDNCDVCAGINHLRRSQTLLEADLHLSKVKSLTDFSFSRTQFSTDRSSNDSKLKKSTANHKFGETEKKLPSNSYFASVLE